MAVIYRTTGAWGAGKGSNLTAAEVDGNFYDHDGRIGNLETSRPQPDNWASVEIDGTAVTFTTIGGSIFTIDLPVLKWRFRDAWAAFTGYAALDTFTVDGVGLFLVNIDHTSAATFDPDAVDGESNPLYTKLIGFGGVSVVIVGGTVTALTDFAIRDTSAAFDVTIAADSSTALTAGRTLTLDMDNVAHTLAFGSTANTITFPSEASYTLIGDGDTGTVTDAMLAGSITAAHLVGTDIDTVGTLTAGVWNAGDICLSTSGIFGFGASGMPDLLLTRKAAANLNVGAAAAASPVAQTVTFQGVVAGTSNTAGANATIVGSLATGNAASGSLVFQTGVVGSSGTTVQTPGAALTLNGSQNALFGALAILKNYTVLTLPTGIQGAVAYVTDALAPTLGATVVTGGAAKAMVWYNGANWTVTGV